MNGLVAASFDDWLHLVHIIASMLWVGSVITLAALALEAVRGGEPAAVARLLGSLRVVGPAVLAPGPLLLLATGIWSVVRSDTWAFGQTWVWLALVLLAAAFLYGAAFQSRVAVNAQRAAAAGESDKAIRLLEHWAVGSLVILGLLLVATWDMVFKPGV